MRDSGRTGAMVKPLHWMEHRELLRESCGAMGSCGFFPDPANLAPGEKNARPV